MWIRLGVLAFLGLLCWAWLGLLRPMLIANRVAAISIGEEQIQEALRPRSIQFIEEARRKPITTHVAMPMPNAGQGGKFTTEAELKPAESLLLGLVPWANTLRGLLVLKVTRRSDGRMEMNAELLSAADGAKAAERLRPWDKDPGFHREPWWWMGLGNRAGVKPSGIGTARGHWPSAGELPVRGRRPFCCWNQSQKRFCRFNGRPR